MDRASRVEGQILGELRALCPVARRREHVLLLLREGTAPPIIRAIVRAADAPALRPLADRLLQNTPGAELRAALAEDGALDVVGTWHRGVGLDVYLQRLERAEVTR